MSTKVDKASAGDLGHLMTAIAGFDTAMLVTRSRDGELRARPMAIAKTEADGRVWFVTDVESAKISEIAGDGTVDVTMQAPMRFVSISGHARIVRDHNLAKELWKEPWRVWFPDGPEETDLVLVCVEPKTAEYWDNRGPKGLRFLVDMVRHYVGGTKKDDRQEETPSMHGKVDLHGEA